MKQFNFLPAKALMILFAFFIVACEDDDSEEPKVNALVGGTWQWTANERSNCGETGSEGKTDLTDCTEGCRYYEFKADGSLTITFKQTGASDEKVSGTYSLVDGKLTICTIFDGTEECDFGEGTISGDTFSWLFPKEEETGCDVHRIFEKV